MCHKLLLVRGGEPSPSSIDTSMDAKKTPSIEGR